ncbi:hypothetical protein [Bradyrhizobium hipponense]|uniref:hypothetical protein n=1 Tax=Bradyrhizobium hipponense TaxID=2605638 RepID=UPI001652CBA1|nr:hypothetical protein [Bradyrhizobium hipponense]
MDTSFEYRSYVVRRSGATFCAESTDGERFKIRSANLLRVTRAIDTMWNALEGKVPAPEWTFGSDLVDLDAAADAMLVVGRGASVFPTVPRVGLSVQAAA